MRVLALCGMVMLAAITTPARGADADKGKKLFAVCAKCHPITPDSDSTLVGPPLKGVVGRKAASVEDFRYSSAMRASGITWTEQELGQYLANPQAKVKGNRMALTAAFEPGEIDDIVAYLKTLK